MTLGNVLEWLIKGFVWALVLLGGFAYSKILENHGQRMLDRNFKPGFKAWMHQKDLRIVMEEAHRMGLMLPSAAATAHPATPRRPPDRPRKSSRWSPGGA